MEVLIIISAVAIVGCFIIAVCARYSRLRRYIFPVEQNNAVDKAWEKYVHVELEYFIGGAKQGTMKCFAGADTPGKYKIIIPKKDSELHLTILDPEIKSLSGTRPTAGH